MDERADIVRRVRRLVAEQRFAALSTHRGGAPYANLVAYASEDLRHVVFSTMRATRKFGNLTDDPRVALLFDNRTNEETDLQEAIAATATGLAVVAEGEERERLAKVLLARHPHLGAFVESPGCAVIRVDIDTYHAVVRFQNVFELHVDAADVAATEDVG